MDQASPLNGNQVKHFCIKNNIDLIPTPANDHRAVGLIERLISSTKQRLACIKEANNETNIFNFESALELILQQFHYANTELLGF